jgi:hypothetical protein
MPPLQTLLETLPALLAAAIVTFMVGALLTVGASGGHASRAAYPVPQSLTGAALQPGVPAHD